jgi:hypothetical protein
LFFGYELSFHRQTVGVDCWMVIIIDTSLDFRWVTLERPYEWDSLGRDLLW